MTHAAALYPCRKPQTARFAHLVYVFILPIISAGYGTVNYLQNLEILRDGWYSLWTQHTLFYSLFFFPCMVAVYAAYLWRLEHIGHNWNLIMAEPVPPFYLFLAKLLVVTKLVLLTQAFVFVLYWFCGRVFAGFTAPPPAITIFYLVRSVLGGLAVVAAQLLFSMVIRSFALPVFLGLAGVFPACCWPAGATGTPGPIA